MARIRTGTTPRATKPKTTLRATNATEKMTAMVDLETIHQAAFGAFWLTRASSVNPAQKPYLRVSLSSVVIRALDFYLEHLDTLPPGEAHHSEFKAVERVVTRKPLEAVHIDRIAALLQQAQTHCETQEGHRPGAGVPEMVQVLPALWHDLRTGTTAAERKARDDALRDKVEAMLPKKYQTREGQSPAPQRRSGAPLDAPPWE